MAHTTWFFIVYGAGLFHLALHPDRVRDAEILRKAIFWFILSAALALPFNAGLACCSMSEKIGVSLWAEGISWLCVSRSLWLAFGALGVPPGKGL